MDILRRLPLDGIINCRDLGGYPCADGSVTRFGRLYRFGMPKDSSPQDAAALYAQGVRAIVDLRSSMEVKRHPGVFANHPDFKQVNIPLYEVNPTFIRRARELWNIYQISLERYEKQYAQVFRFLLDASEPTAFHCHGGKDRTGIVAAILLSLAGVSREDIIADYCVSATYLAAHYVNIPKKRFQFNRKEKFLCSDPALAEQLLQFLQERCGGAEGYLKKIGLSPEECAGLARLLK